MPPINTNTRQIGGRWEIAAESFLHKRGLTTHQRNFYSRFGEIDLIMRDKDEFVFVEVRFRQNSRHGSGADTVTFQKQAKLTRAALYFLCRNPRYAQNPCRFDVISITITNSEPKFNWIKNAFDSTSG
jgi:putative endonuclease